MDLTADSAEASCVFDDLQRSAWLEARGLLALRYLLDQKAMGQPVSVRDESIDLLI